MKDQFDCLVSIFFTFTFSIVDFIELNTRTMFIMKHVISIFRKLNFTSLFEKVIH